MVTIKGILAGILITLGGRVYTSLCLIDSSYGKIIGAILFSIGLIVILVYGLPLFTGRIGYTNIKNKTSIVNVLLILLQNLVGCLIAGYLIYEASGEKQLKLISSLIETKLNTSLLDTLILAILCGALMFIAAESYKRTNGIIIPILCVSVFILSGYEHCIANMGYIVEWGINNLFIQNIISTEVLNITIKLVITIIGNSIGAIALRKIVTKDN